MLLGPRLAAIRLQENTTPLYFPTYGVLIEYSYGDTGGVFLGGSAGGAQRSTDRVHVLKDLPVGPEETRFIIMDGPLLAEYFDEFLCPAEIFSRHSRKQMVLDLAAELAEEEVGKTIRQKVSGGNDLPVEEVHIIDHGHTLVIRGKGQAHVEAKDRLVDQDKHYALQRPQEVGQESDVEHKV